MVYLGPLLPLLKTPLTSTALAAMDIASVYSCAVVSLYEQL